MGVSKLWDVLLTIAVPNNIQDLSGLILAIDASLWIFKINSIFENVDQGLKCLFNKIIWLKKNNIKPIFVFDGQTPLLKRKTLEQRRNKRKQVNDLDITKKVQIQIIKTINGTQSQKSEKQNVKNSYDQKTQQIDRIFNNLMDYQKCTNTIQLSQKIEMQSEVLNKKYEFYSQLNNKILKKHGDLQYFFNLDIQSKEQILEQVQLNDLPSGKDVRKLKQSMSEQQKIMYEMQIIKKKSKILELQDNLYRKVMTKKIQNGYQIIQGIYNGKKVVQKKKIKQQGFDSWGLKVNKKKETCNNFHDILKHSKYISQSEQNNQKQQQEQDNFFNNIFNKDYRNEKRQSSQNTFEQISQRLSQISNQPMSVNNQQFNYIKKKENNKDKDSGSQFQYYNFFEDIQLKKQKQGEYKQNSNNLDNFPDFLHIQKLNQTSISNNNNIHLQNMLDILGINYIIAPYQAQAQCAALQEMGLVDGVVTEDSDVFLFGARRVYRGVFQDNIKYYEMSKIQQKLFLTREKLVLFALMLGSDYTDGIKGIGIVNAMEILKIHHDIESLQKFTSWAKNSDIFQEDQKNRTDYMLQNAMSEDERQFYKLHKKFKNYWHVHPNFPQKNIYQAYIQPPVKSGKQIEKKVKQTKKVNQEGLKILMQQKFKMSSLQMQINYKIFSKPFQRITQRQITQFTSGNLAKIVSKRLKKAINLRDNLD